MSFGELENYEYLTGQYLGYKPSVVGQAKFEYSLLGKALVRDCKKEDKKEELL